MKNQILSDIKNTGKSAPVKVEFIYTREKEIAAIHLFTKKGLITYNRSGMDFTPAGDSAYWDSSWFGNYE